MYCVCVMSNCSIFLQRHTAQYSTYHVTYVYRYIITRWKQHFNKLYKRTRAKMNNVRISTLICKYISIQQKRAVGVHISPELLSQQVDLSFFIIIIWTINGVFFLQCMFYQTLWIEVHIVHIFVVAISIIHVCMLMKTRI